MSNSETTFNVNVAHGSQFGRTINNNYGSSPPGAVLELDEPTPYDPAQWSDDKTSRFCYQAQSTPLFGRAAELDQLREFMDGEYQFRWWLIGGIGGIGKSRLAFELALEYQAKGWRTGFLSCNGKTEISRHEFLTAPPPDWLLQPTLVIIDHFSGEEKQIGEAIARLATRLRARRTSSDHPFRLLLVDREVEPDCTWWEQFNGTGNRIFQIENSAYKNYPLVLQPLNESDWNRIVLEWPGQRQLPTDFEKSLNLRSESYKGRPLFASLLADALKRGEGLVKLDHRSLIDLILKQEQERWNKLGVTDADLRLLLIATLCRGGINLAADHLPELVEQLLKSALQKDTPSFQERCLTMTGHSLQNHQPRLSPLEPDLLGELLILELLKPTSPITRHDKNRALQERIVQAAWLVNPFGVLETISRAAQDFPEHKALFPLAGMEPTAMASTLGWLCWGRLVVKSIAYAGEQQLEPAFSLWKQLADKAANRPGELLLALQFMGAAILIRYFIKAGRANDSHKLYDTLVELASSHTREPQLRETQADCAFNLITFYGTAGKMDEATKLYADLTELAKHYPSEPSLRKQQAKGAFNLIVCYINSQQIPEARKLRDSMANSAEFSRLWQEYGDRLSGKL